LLRPATEADLAEAVATATGPLSIRGGGTRGVAAEGEALTTSGVSGITLYEPGALTLVAKAGTPVAEIEAALAAENQMLAFEPMDHRPLLGTTGEPTIGGVVATNTSGPRRVQAGACRDFLLGVRFVDGAGTIVRNGGRVMKNVTGYDLTKLMCGAAGTLGILTEVSLKVLPRPECVATLVFDGPDMPATLDILLAAMGSPFEVSGAAWLPPGQAGEQGAALVRIEGFEASVAYRAEALRARLGDARLVTDPAENDRLWRAVRDVTPLADRAGDVWSVSVRPADFPALVAGHPDDGILVDWAGGRLWLSLPPGTDFRARMTGVGGHATRVRGSGGPVPRLHPEPAPLAALARGLRAKYDPRGVLNPGAMA